MSKESKPRDLRRQLGQVEHDRAPDHCPGCGYFYSTNGFHRDDCTSKKGVDNGR